MAGRIWIPPYKPLGVSTQAVPGGGYINVDPSVGQFGGSVLGGWLGGQGADGDAGVAQAVSAQLAVDNEAVVKAADIRLGETEQALLFDPQNGFLNMQGQAALTKVPETLDAYGKAQDRELDEVANDDQREMLRGLNERRLAIFTTQVERHAETERQRWYDGAGERRIAQMQVDARLHWSDDALLRRALGTTRAEVREKAERRGWDTALTEATLRQHTSRILVAAIEGAVERDPDRARAVRTRYAQHIEAADQPALDALLAEAQTRRRVDAASAEILNATPPDGEPSTPQWRLRQAEAITESAVRAATIRRLTSAAAATEARARALAEQVLARVLKDCLTDPSQIPVREWVSLDAEHRQAIETRLDHNTAGTEPAKNSALVDELATQVTRTPHEFARRDLVPTVAHLPLPQWQRFRDWQTGLRRNDPETEDQIYAIKRGLQLANKMLPADMAEGEAPNVRAGLVEDIATRRRITGKSPGDADIADMLARRVPTEAGAPHTLEWDPHDRPELVPMRFPFPSPDQHDRPGIHRIHDGNTTMAPSAAALRQMRALMEQTQRAVFAAQRALAAAEAQVRAARAAAQAIPKSDVHAASNAAQALQAALKAREAAAREHDLAVEFDEYVEEQMRAWSYQYAGQRFTRILEKNAAHEAAKLGYVPADGAPIDANGETVFVHPDTGDYIVRATDRRTPGVWERFDRDGNRIGFFGGSLLTPYPDPPLNPGFKWATTLPDAARPHAIEANPPMSPEDKAKWAAEQKAKQLAAQKAREEAALKQGGVTVDGQPPEGDNRDDDDESDNDDVEDENDPRRKNRKFRTTKAAKRAAEKLGYQEIRYTDDNAKMQKVFRNPGKDPEYIARDTTNHKGSWKSFKFERGRLVRTGTWNADLTKQLGD